MRTVDCSNKTTYSKGRQIQWVVIHYTAGTSSNAGVAFSIANGFRTDSRDASADYIVDDAEVISCNPDPHNRYTWAVGGSKYRTMTTTEGGKYYGQCKNSNSVHIEMCSSKVNKKTLNASDTDWYITDKVIQNTIALTKDLMAKYGIDINHVIMHHHVTGKICPNPFCVNGGALSKWYEFKSRLTGQSVVTPSQPKPVTPSGQFTIKTTCDVLNIRSGPGTNYPSTGKISETSNKKNIYTIVETQNGWGKLKSGIGWISLAYTITV